MMGPRLARVHGFHFGVSQGNREHGHRQFDATRTPSNIVYIPHTSIYYHIGYRFDIYQEVVGMYVITTSSSKSFAASCLPLVPRTLPHIRMLYRLVALFTELRCENVICYHQEFSSRPTTTMTTIWSRLP